MRSAGVLTVSFDTCIVQYMTDAEQAERHLAEYAKVIAFRDARVREARAAGLSKNRIHTLSGLCRATIDRILERTTTQLHDYATYAGGGAYDLRDTVLNFLGDQADTFDVDGLTDAYRDAINAELEGSTIVLRGRTFYANYPAPDDATELIKDAIERADLGALLEKFDRS